MPWKVILVWMLSGWLPSVLLASTSRIPARLMTRDSGATPAPTRGEKEPNPPPGPLCTETPTQVVLVSRLTRNGAGNPVLHFTDPNDPGLVTGYNVYRAPGPTGPWSQIGANAADSDGGTAGIQFVDAGGVGGTLLHYQVAAYNLACSTEGPWASDILPPSVTLEQAAGQADPTASSPVNFTVTFNEPVTGFTAADVSTVGSTATIGSISVTGVNPYNVAVAASSDGTVVASIPANAAVDAAGNWSRAATSNDNSVILDTRPPQVAITSLVLGAVDSPTFTFSADEPATFFCRKDAGAWSVCTSPWTYSGMPLGVPHTIEVYAVDMVGLPSAPASRSWLIPLPNVSGGSPYIYDALQHTLVLTTISLTAPVPHPSHPNPQATNRITYVRPNATVQLNVIGSFDFTGSSCQGCVTQFYIGISGLPISGGGNLCLGSGVGYVSVNASTSFTAPNTTGVYVLNPTATLGFSCLPSSPISNQLDANSIATLVVLE